MGRETDMDNPKIKYMICKICGEKVHPLDAHTGILNDELIVAHIDCWNNAYKVKY